MDSSYDVLGVSPDATLSQIETAFQRQWTFWNDLQSNANRAAEAEAMIARLEFAHDRALAKFKGQEGGLVDPAPTTQSGFGGSGVFPSAQGGTTKSIDKDVCPQCGMREDSPDAVYCTNRECRFELKPCCPGCNKRIAWYKEICPYCGIDIEEVKEKTRLREEEIRYEEEQARLKQEQRWQEEISIKQTAIRELEIDLAALSTQSSLGGHSLLAKKYPEYTNIWLNSSIFWWAPIMKGIGGLLVVVGIALLTSLLQALRGDNSAAQQIVVLSYIALSVLVIFWGVMAVISATHIENRKRKDAIENTILTRIGDARQMLAEDRTRAV